MTSTVPCSSYGTSYDSKKSLKRHTKTKRELEKRISYLLKISEWFRFQKCLQVFLYIFLQLKSDSVFVKIIFTLNTRAYCVTIKKSRILEEHIIFSSRFISVVNTCKLITKSISNTDGKVKNNSITLLFWENKGRKPIRVKVNYIQSKAVFWKSSIS